MSSSGIDEAGSIPAPVEVVHVDASCHDEHRSDKDTITDKVKESDTAPTPHANESMTHTPLPSSGHVTTQETGARIVPYQPEKECIRTHIDDTQSHRDRYALVAARSTTLRHTSHAPQRSGGLLGESATETQLVLGGGRAGIAVMESLLMSNRVVANPVISASMTLYSGAHAMYDYCAGTPNRLGHPTSGRDVAVRVGTELGCTAVGSAIGVGVSALFALSAVPLVGQVVLSTLVSLGLGYCVSSLFTGYVDRMMVRMQIRAQYGYPCDESGARRRLEELLHTRHDLSSFDTCTLVQHYVDYRVACGWEDAQDMEDYRAGRFPSSSSLQRQGNSGEEDNSDSAQPGATAAALPVSLQHVAVVQLQRRWGFVHSRLACARVYRALMLLHHPDRGGSAAMAARLNADYALYAQCQGWGDRPGGVGQGRESDAEESRTSRSKCNDSDSESDARSPSSAPVQTRVEACRAAPPRRRVLVDFLRALVRPASNSIADAHVLHARGVLAASSTSPHLPPPTRRRGTQGRQSTISSHSRQGGGVLRSTAVGGEGGHGQTRTRLWEQEEVMVGGDGEGGAAVQLRTQAAVKQRTVARMLDAVQRSYRNCSEAIMFGELASAAAAADKVKARAKTHIHVRKDEDEDAAVTATMSDASGEADKWHEMCRAAHRFVRLQHFLMMCASSNTSRRAVLNGRASLTSSSSSPSSSLPAALHDDRVEHEEKDEERQQKEPLLNSARGGWSDENEARIQREVQRRALIAAVCTDSMTHTLESAATLWQSAKSLAENYFHQTQPHQHTLHHNHVHHHHHHHNNSFFVGTSTHTSGGVCEGKSSSSSGRCFETGDATAQTLDTLIHIRRTLDALAHRATAATHPTTHTTVWADGVSSMNLADYVAMAQVRRVALIASWALSGMAARVTMETAQEVCTSYFAARERVMRPAPAVTPSTTRVATRPVDESGPLAHVCACSQCSSSNDDETKEHTCRTPCTAAHVTCVTKPSSSSCHDLAAARAIRCDSGTRVDALLHAWLEACERHYPDERIRAPLTQLPSSALGCLSAVVAPRWLRDERERTVGAHYGDVQAEPAVYLHAGVTHPTHSTHVYACSQEEDDCDDGEEGGYDEEVGDGCVRECVHHHSSPTSDTSDEGALGVTVSGTLLRASFTDPLTGVVSFCWLKRYVMTPVAAAASPSTRTVPEWIVRRVMRRELAATQGCVSDYVIAATDVLYTGTEEEEEDYGVCPSAHVNPSVERAARDEEDNTLKQPHRTTRTAAEAAAARVSSPCLCFHMPRQATQQRFSSVRDIEQHIFAAQGSSSNSNSNSSAHHHHRPHGVDVLRRALRWLHEALTCVIELHSSQLAHTHITLSNFTFDDFESTALGYFAPVQLHTRRRKRGIAGSSSRHCSDNGGGAVQRASVAALLQDEIDFGAMLLAEVCPCIPVYATSPTPSPTAAHDVHCTTRHVYNPTPRPTHRDATSEEDTHPADCSDHPHRDTNDDEEEERITHDHRALDYLHTVLHQVAERLIGKEEPRWSLPEARAFVRRCGHWTALEAGAAVSYFVHGPAGIRYPAFWRVHPSAPLAEMRVREMRGWRLHPSVWQHRRGQPHEPGVKIDAATSPLQSRNDVMHVTTRPVVQQARRDGPSSASIFLNMNAALWEVYGTCRRAMTMALAHRGNYTAPAALLHAPSPFLCACSCADDDGVNERYLWYFPPFPTRTADKDDDDLTGRTEQEEELWRVCQEGFDPARYGGVSAEQSQVTLHLHLPLPHVTKRSEKQQPEWALLCRVALGTVVDDASDAPPTTRPEVAASGGGHTPLEAAVRRRCHLMREVNPDGTPGAPSRVLVPCPWLRCYPEYMVYIH